jgi:hypothetical protein
MGTRMFFSLSHSKSHPARRLFALTLRRPTDIIVLSLQAEPPSLVGGVKSELGWEIKPGCGISKGKK